LHEILLLETTGGLGSSSVENFSSASNIFHHFTLCSENFLNVQD
jgi:hypothetical protein